MEIHFYVLYALAGISIAIGVAALLKIKTAIYLLEQPVVKKMSPQLNLKPIKVDQVDGDASRNQPRSNGTPMNRTAGGRPEGRDDRPPREGGRDGRDRMPRADRDSEPAGRDGRSRDGGDRPPRSDRAERGDRGDRFGGRDRGGRDGERGPRPDRGGDRGDRPPRREFSSTEREPMQPQAEGAPRPAPVADTNISSGAPLAPRRPLPSTVDGEGQARSAPIADIPAPVSEATAADPFFNRDDSDIQHGRRNQLKKKPKFEAEDVEEKTEETKAL